MSPEVFAEIKGYVARGEPVPADLVAQLLESSVVCWDPPTDEEIRAALRARRAKVLAAQQAGPQGTTARELLDFMEKL